MTQEGPRPPSDRDAPDRRAHRVLLLVLLAVAVVALVAAALAATRRAPVYDGATPEGVVQAYLAAVVDRRDDEAVRLLAAASACTAADLDRASVPDGVRVVLRDAETTGDTARVDVTVAVPSGDLFGAPETTERHTFRLVRSDAGWRLTGEPWPLSACGRST